MCRVGSLTFSASGARLRGILLHEVTSAVAVDLHVSIGALRLRNPILAASGTFGYGLEFAHLIDLNRLGGFVTKGLSREPIEGAPAPRLYPTPSGMLNAVGLQNVGVRAFVTEKLPVLRKFDTAVIANVFGYSLEDYVEVIRVLEDAEGLAAYELNVSCPNVKKGGMQFGGDPALIAEVVGAARKTAAKRPLWVKLSPLVTDIGLIAREAEGAGADALTVANTYPAMALDVRTLKSRLGNQTGGLSGPAILQISSYWHEGETLSIDLAPELRAEDFLRGRKRDRPKAELKTVLGEILPARLAQAVAGTVASDATIANLPDRSLAAIGARLNGWKVIPTGSEGWDKAEVTAGGVDTAALSSKTMEVRNIPGLYIIGEAVDVTGWLGGYNFQWAWSSGWCAGQAV